MDFHSHFVVQLLRVEEPSQMSPRCFAGSFIVPTATRRFLSPWHTHQADEFFVNIACKAKEQLHQYAEEPSRHDNRNWIGH